jgi:hypothetical protein
MRATLHDELMRAAGFETEYHEALARRREARQARVRSTPVLVLRALILLLLVVFVLDVFGFVHLVPKPLAGVLTFFSVGLLTDFGLRLVWALLVRVLRVLPVDWESPDEPLDGQPTRTSRGWAAP